MSAQYRGWAWDMLLGVVDAADVLELWALYPDHLREVDDRGVIRLWAWSDDQRCRFAPIVLKPLKTAA